MRERNVADFNDIFVDGKQGTSEEMGSPFLLGLTFIRIDWIITAIIIAQHVTLQGNTRDE